MEPSEVKPFISLPDPGACMRSPTGNRIAVRADGTQTGGVFALLEAEDTAGAATPPHVHVHDAEAFLCVEGRYRFHCAEETFEGGPGSFVLLPKGRPHHSALRDEHSRMLIWLFPSGMEGYFREVAHLPPEDRANLEFMKQLTARYGPVGLPRITTKDVNRCRARALKLPGERRRMIIGHELPRGARIEQGLTPCASAARR